jgi:mannose-6-phosphate isomerase-like protein (cupin superfamily)
MSETSQSLKQSIPPDDPLRELAIPDEKSLHIGVVGDTYTIFLTGKDTAGRFCLIDMHVPPGGGPPPHRHDFEETFSILEGELEVTFRGSKRVVQAGTTIRRECSASVHQLARRNSFSRSAHRLQPVRCLRPNLMKRHKQSSGPRSER